MPDGYFIAYRGSRAYLNLSANTRNKTALDNSAHVDELTAATLNPPTYAQLILHPVSFLLTTFFFIRLVDGTPLIADLSERSHTMHYLRNFVRRSRQGTGSHPEEVVPGPGLDRSCKRTVPMQVLNLSPPGARASCMYKIKRFMMKSGR